MRPPQLLALLLCFVALPIFLTFCSLLSSHPTTSNSATANYETKSSRLRTLFSFHSPVSLFPPSAIISLTDDNSTFFLARPAAFGPELPNTGLSNQLWVGSGFGDDDSRKTGSVLGAEGELGCTDVPGWGEEDKEQSGLQSPESQTSDSKAAAPGKGSQELAGGKPKGGNTKNPRSSKIDNLKTGDTKLESPFEADGTDDHLHHPLQESNPAEAAKPGQPAEHPKASDKSKSPTHADIQSLQESAEISGKVVLLSRGGCGFLEKVKWVQRRGGIALIVGDDARGGPLITMYARGDTSNVTIPALFTSHTTAHLLSSLIPPETPDDQISDGFKDGKNKMTKQKTKQSAAGPTYTSSATSTPTSRTSGMKQNTEPDMPDAMVPQARDKGWLGRILSIFGLESDAYHPWHISEDSRESPSRSNDDWILLEDWDERKSSQSKTALQKPSKSGKTEDASRSGKSASSPKGGDDFVIGVQDWRDPDVLAPTDGQDINDDKYNERAPGQSTSTLGRSKAQPTGKPKGMNTLKGGSITPGSGEYDHANVRQGGKSGSSQPKQPHSPTSSQDGPEEGAERGWISRLFSDESSDDTVVDGEEESTEGSMRSRPGPSRGSSSIQTLPVSGGAASDEHEGLWVTLTPATMSTSPFFDTLLVLVVSPLVTLTVVYALLLLRSRIRRRRWRAPKSVVERLPVRVYHTLSTSSSTSSSQLSTPASSSPTSPLLRSTPRTAPSRSRPRSQTTSGVIPSAESSGDRSQTPSSSPGKEKSQAEAAEWRKRYAGRHIECVVCLEEYVDGQSRVMSLPCGHEFHADCMYVSIR
jgi:hypothetical protein